MTKCGELNVGDFFQCVIKFAKSLTELFFFGYIQTEALVRITGAYPAFTRPRKSRINFFGYGSQNVLTAWLAYGAYNDLVRRAFATRRQSLALWDFE